MNYASSLREWLTSGCPHEKHFLCSWERSTWRAPRQSCVARWTIFTPERFSFWGFFFVFWSFFRFLFYFLVFFYFFFVILFPIFCLFFLSPVFLFLSGFLFVHNYASVWSTGERTCFAPSWEHNLVHLGAHVCFRWSIICASPPTEEHFSSLGNTG